MKKERLGTLYFNDKIDKFGKLVFLNNGFVDEHDIKVDVMEKDGKFVALTIQVAHPDMLSTSKEDFEKIGEPTAYIKCDYEKQPSNKLYNVINAVVRNFDMLKDRDKMQYFAMH